MQISIPWEIIVWPYSLESMMVVCDLNILTFSITWDPDLDI